MAKTGPAARPPMTADADSFFDMLTLRRREITAGAIVVAAVFGGVTLWRQAEAKKEERGEHALSLAANSYYSGNQALAKSDLEKMVGRYSGTSAGVRGAMLLAQVLYQDAKWDEGIKRLEAAKGSSAAGPFAAPIEALIAAGYADQNKYDDAARHFVAAAEKAPFGIDKDFHRADAARMLVLAGKKAGAQRIWSELESNPDSPMSREARIRVGELEAAAAGKK